jgi:glycosyltransferase involved in cell wall biosynthesis
MVKFQDNVPKVLFISPYFSFTYGGTSRVVRDLAHVLGKTQISLDLITTNADVDTYLDIPLDTWCQEESYRIRYFHCWNKNDFVISPKLLAWLIHNISNYDIVHTHTIFSPLISLCHLVCRTQEIPYITTPHGMLEPWAMRYKSWKKRAYYFLVERSSLQKANFIQGIASLECKNISLLCPGATVQLVPNGINWSDFYSPRSASYFYQFYPHLKSKKIIFFLGRIDPKKGLDLLASAFGFVYQQIPDVHLVIAGPDCVGFLPTAKQYFASAQCLEAVTFTGMLTGHLKYSALAAADIYVASSYSEGFSMSVLEGMASGIPCVITEGCNFPEAAEHQVAHVVEIKSSAIAEALILCLLNPKEAKRMAARARQFVFENYTWDKVASKLIDIYKVMLSKDPCVFL